MMKLRKAREQIARIIGALRRLRRQEEPWSVKRMREISDMHDFGVAAYRQRMRREHPEASEKQVAAMVREWLAAPPREDRLRLPSREGRS